MTYKEAIDIFNNRLKDIALTRKVETPAYTDEEVMYRLSVVQSNLNAIYHLADNTATIQLVRNQQEYNLVVLVPDYLSTLSIHYKNQKLTPLSYEELMRLDQTEYGYNIRKKILKLNYSPALGYTDDTSEKLDLYYTKRLDVFDYQKGTVHSLTFSDYDKKDADYGGEWQLPVQYHNEIVEGALANLYPELMTGHLQRVMELVKNREITYSGNPTYFFGI